MSDEAADDSMPRLVAAARRRLDRDLFVVNAQPKRGRASPFRRSGELEHWIVPD